MQHNTTQFHECKDQPKQPDENAERKPPPSPTASDVSIAELNDGQEITYRIINAFLNNVTFENSEAECLIKRVSTSVVTGLTTSQGSFTKK